MLAAACAFLAGTALVLGLEELPSWTALAGVAAAGAMAWKAGRRLIACTAAGFVLAAAHGQRALDDDWPCRRDRELMEVVGTVASPAEPRPGRVDFDLLTDRAARSQGVPSLVRVSWYEAAAVPWPGETWRLSLRLRCRSGFSNPGGYDRELDLLRRGYGATGYVSGPDAPRRLYGGGLVAPIASARAWIAQRIVESAGQTASTGVLQGLAVGLRGNIAPELYDAFVATGTAHLIAISGMHVTAFALAMLFLSRRLYRAAGDARFSAAWPAVQGVMVVGVTCGYGLLAGASLPTVRTVAMVAVAASLRLARRHASVADVLAAAAVLLVATDPLAVTSAGFWLSFAAVAALICLADPGPGPRAAFVGFARAQASVTFVLTPVLVAAFGAVPLLGPAVNALAIPLFSTVILPATLLGSLLLPAPGLAGPWWSTLGAALDLCWPALTWIAQGRWASFSPPAAPPWLLAASLAAALAVTLVPGRSLKWLAGVLLATLLLRPAAAPVAGAFELAVMDVGHGLATVIRTHRHVLVFDTGSRWRSGADAARVTLVPYLRSLGVRRIDLLVVSHDDLDHAGGLEALQHAFAVAAVRGDPGPRPGSEAAPCRAGDSWHWDGVSFTVLHPPAGTPLQGNDASCALRVDGGGGSLLLLADTGTRAEASLLRQRLAADIVLVPHHGSRSSSSKALVEAVGAGLALVSAGYGNRWNLPQPQIVGRWRAAGARVLTTAETGAIRVEVTPAAGIGPARTTRFEDRRWWHRR